MRFIAANTHPEHDTIVTFRRRNYSAFSAAFEHILPLTSQSGLLKVGTVSVDGARIKANAGKIKSIRYDRIQISRKRWAKDIAELMDKAEAADNAPDDDGTRLPEALSRRKTLKAKLDEAAKRLEEEAGRDHDDERAPPAVKADKQINLTDPESAIMRKPPWMRTQRCLSWRQMCYTSRMTGRVLRPCLMKWKRMNGALIC